MKFSGGETRANADISSVKWVRTPFTENPRFPERGQSTQGKSKPKMKPNGLVDGKQVNIPAPRLWSEARAEEDSDR